MRAEQLRQAKALLDSRGLTRPKPRKLVKAASELGLGLAETLAFLMRLKQGPQNQQAQRREILARVSE